MGRRKRRERGRRKRKKKKLEPLVMTSWVVALSPDLTPAAQKELNKCVMRSNKCTK